MDRYFQENQKSLIKIINDDEVKFLLEIKTSYPIVKITSNSYHLIKGVSKNLIELEARFWSIPYFSKHLYPLMQKYRFGGNFHIPMYFNTLVANPNTGSGRILNQNQASWSAARGNASGTLTDGNFDIRSDTNWTNGRAYSPFITSSLTSSATISSATADYYRDDSWAALSNTDSTTIEVVPSTQSSDTSLALSDFSQVTFTSKGSLAFSSTVNASYNHITISDLTSINKTGDTKYTFITGRDLNNSTPTGSNLIGASSAHTPTLTVTYTLPATGRILGSLSMLGIGN